MNNNLASKTNFHQLKINGLVLSPARNINKYKAQLISLGCMTLFSIWIQLLAYYDVNVLALQSLFADFIKIWDSYEMFNFRFRKNREVKIQLNENARKSTISLFLRFEQGIAS